MKSNIHKKITFEDKFARKYYCLRHARLNTIRDDKKKQKSDLRNYYKKMLLKGYDD